MKYTFDIVGVSPVLYFFNRQQQAQQNLQTGVEYLGAYKCTLDAVLKSVENLPTQQGWELDRVVDTVLNFWMKNSDSIQYWRSRLSDAGRDNVLVARVADIKSLKAEFESLLGE